MAFESELEIPDQRKHWESSDYTITKNVLKEGDLDTWRPRQGATGEIEIVLNSVSGIDQNILQNDSKTSKYFQTKDGGERREFFLGSADTEVDRTLEKCLQNFLVGEKSQVTMRSLIEPDLNRKKTQVDSEPVWVIIDCTLSLLTLLNADPIYKWFPQTKLSKAREAHSAGVKLFQEQRYMDCFHKFRTAFQLAVLALGPKQSTKENVDPPDASEQEVKEEAKKLKQLCYNNLAACHFQWKNYSSVIQLSDLVLKEEPNLVKTLYRRGVAHLELANFEKAERDLVMAHKMEPANRAVNDKLGQVKIRQKAHKVKMSKQMSKMFS